MAGLERSWERRSGAPIGCLACEYSVRLAFDIVYRYRCAAKYHIRVSNGVLLLHGFRYKEEVLALRNPLVAASLQLHAAVSAHLLPTPAKTHYIFNLRDLSKLFQVRCSTGEPARLPFAVCSFISWQVDGTSAFSHSGKNDLPNKRISRTQGMSFVGEALEHDPQRLQRLWVHEALRVYHDRLVDEGDREWIAATLRTTAEKHFPGCKFDSVRVCDACWLLLGMHACPPLACMYLPPSRCMDSAHSLLQKAVKL